MKLVCINIFQRNFSTFSEKLRLEMSGYEKLTISRRMLLQKEDNFQHFQSQGKQRFLR